MLRPIPPTLIVAAMVATACSSSSSSGSSSSTASAPKASVSASASTKPAAPPKPTAPPAPTLTCPEDYYQNELPAYCMKLEQARPGRAEPDGPWLTQSVGAGASLSTSRTKSVEETVQDERAQWGTDALKERSKYEEAVDRGRTIIKFKRFDPKDDPKAADAKDVVIVVGKSGDATLRCEVSGDMSPSSVCLTMIVPP